VVPVSEVAGKPVYQCYIGSSANPGLRDFGIAALMVDGRHTHDEVSFDVNPTSREILENLSAMGLLGKLLHAGARLHQAGCNGCIGMGQAPASGRISLRTVPRNFPGRSGTKEDSVYLCSPETATASALTGKITDPRTLDFDYPEFRPPENPITNTATLSKPPADDSKVELVKGPNIKPLPEGEPLPDDFTGPVLIKVADDISTDEIMPAGARVLPFRSNIPEIAKFVFSQVDEDYYERAMAHQDEGHVIVGGRNYGQGSSREHAALAPRYLGVRVVLAKDFARIHRQNLANFGILPLVFDDTKDYERIEAGDELEFKDLNKALEAGNTIEVHDTTQDFRFKTHHELSERQVEMVRRGNLMNVVREKQQRA
jgi:aconitate hydratase